MIGRSSSPSGSSSWKRRSRLDQHIGLDVGPVAMTTPSGTSEPAILDRRQLATPSLRY